MYHLGFYSRGFNKTPFDVDRVVIVSYNILGTENAAKHPELYRGVLPKHLDWEYRKKVLYKEVKSYQASILCFQASLSSYWNSCVDTGIFYEQRENSFMCKCSHIPKVIQK